MGDEASEEATKRWWSKLNLLTLLVGAVVTTAVTLAGTYAYSRITEEKVRLRYSVTPTPPLFGPLEGDRVFTVEIENSGDREANNVRLGLTARDGEISEYDVTSPAALDVDSRLDEDRTVYLGSTSILNGGDAFSVSLLVTGGLSEQDNLGVDLRADGAIGSRRSTEDSSGSDTSWPSVLSIAAGVIGLLTAITFQRSRGVFAVEEGADIDNKLDSCQEIKLARAAMTSTNYSIAWEYLRRAPKTTLWFESCYITTVAVEGITSASGETWSNAEAISTLTAMVEDKGTGVAPSSRAVIYLNLSRLWQAEGDAGKATEWLAKAKELDAQVVEYFGTSVA